MFSSEKIVKIISFNLLDFEHDKPVDKIVINQGLLLLTILGSIITAIIGFTNQDLIYGVISILLLIISVANLFIYKSTRLYFSYSVLCILLFYTITTVIFFLYSFKFPADIIWFSLFPILSIFLIGPRKGSLLSSLILVLLIFSFYVHYLIYDEIDITVKSMVVFSMYYMVILLGTLGFGLMYYRIEKSLVKAKKDVRKSKKERKDFISRLSHEMRTPLNDMVVLNSLLEQSNLNDKQKSIIETLKASTNNLVNSVQEISAASSPDRSIRHFENVVFNMKKAMEGTIEFYIKKEIGEITFLYDNNNGPDEIIGDPVTIKQILLLFIESFLKSKSRPEELKIDFSINVKESIGNKVYYLFKLNSNFKVFKSEEGLINLLETDEQGANAKSQEDLQLLNIRMGKNIIQSLEGKLEIETEDQFTSLIFTLPFSIPNESVHNKFGSAKIPDFDDTKSSLKLNDANVLLVEDNELNQKILLIGLKSYIKNIDVAIHGKIALDMFGTSNYDLILMDIQMQEMDGITATRKIREIEESTNSHVPIIAVTANALLGDRETCLSAGMDEYISKPFQIEELLEKMQNLINR